MTDNNVQIWHTDPNRVYDHPSFPGQWDLYPDFQYYGTALTDNNGRFKFQTYCPGIYPYQPITHIHVRVFLGGELKLTTLMYFVDKDPNYPKSLILNVEEVKDDDSNYYHATTKNLVIDLGGSGNLTKKTEQQAGPFYPLEDFFNVNVNLVVSDDFYNNAATSLGPSNAPSNKHSSEPSQSTTARSSNVPSFVTSNHPSAKPFAIPSTGLSSLPTSVSNPSLFSAAPTLNNCHFSLYLMLGRSFKYMLSFIL